MEYSKKTVGPRDAQPANEATADDRRRLGKIVHDDRGNAVVQWEEAPPNYQRPVFEIEHSSHVQRRLGADSLSLDPQSCDPYSNAGPLERKRPQSTGNTTRTDLRKLSEWIKLMREMEQRKQRAGQDEED